MNSNKFANENSKELVDAEAHLWSHIFSFQNSMALKCAMELGIPDAIHKHGEPITLAELGRAVGIQPTKAPCLHRLMRFLVHSDFFSRKPLEDGEFVYDLTVNSRILLKDHPLSQAPFALLVFERALVEPASHLSSWFRNASESPFQVAHGINLWEYIHHKASSVGSSFNEKFNQGMASSTRFAANLLMKDDKFKGLFEGMESLVDVGGGDGTLTKAIAETYPKLKCRVLDLAHVVKELKAGSPPNLTYVAGDMFEAIPPSQVVLLKWILHDWSDEKCMKILEQCKKAIPSKDEGGKIIIVDIVMFEDKNEALKYDNIQMLFDMEIMCNVGGKERSEKEWKKLLTDSGFSDYKTYFVSSSCSFVEVYP